MSDLSEALVDAAAAVLPVAFCESMGIPEGSRDAPGGSPEDWQVEAREAVAAVLETLAVNGSWLPDIEPGWYMTASEVNELLRRLAAEVKSEEDR